MERTTSIIGSVRSGRLVVRPATAIAKAPGTISVTQNAAAIWRNNNTVQGPLAKTANANNGTRNDRP